MNDPTWNPLDDPANATVGDFIRLTRARMAEHKVPGTTLRMLLVPDGEEQPEAFVILSVGSEAAKWAALAEEVFAGRKPVDGSIVQTSTDLEAPAVRVDGLKQ